MIEIDEQPRRIEEIVGELLHETYPTSCNLVIPPGFEQSGIVSRISEQLRSRSAASGAVVAFIEPDRLRDSSEFTAELYSQWGRQCRLPRLEEAPKNHTALNSLVGWLPEGRPAIQVISRFHKIIDCLGADVLAKIRGFEQAGKVRTLSITPLPYAELKQRVEDHTGRILTVSDYGNNPLHRCHVVKPAGIESVRAYLASHGVNGRISEFIRGLTGGYPGALDAVLSEWIRLDRPDLRPVVRKHLFEIAMASLSRFVDWLDYKRTRSFTEQVTHVYEGIEVEQALSQLRRHPWRDVILDDDELRAEALGAASREILLGDLIAGKDPASRPQTIVDQAEGLYRARRFNAALKILDGVTEGSTAIRIKSLRLHARIMNNLYSSDGDSMGADADWSAVASGVQEAADYLQTQGKGVSDESLLLDRYNTLREVSQVISTAVRGNPPTIRLVDLLAGLLDPEQYHPREAALILVVQTETAKSILGHTTACQVALPLPEQIFRVWAFWALGLNYYRASTLPDDVYLDANKVWKKRGRGELLRPSLGEPFPSFPSFAYYCVGVMGRCGDRPFPDAPCTDYASVDRAMASFELRNDTAHAVTLTRRPARAEFFRLVERWMDCLISRCSVKTTRAQLTSLIEPLPLIGQNRELIWF
jgi:hypothetical protein